jgi:hypothetical protein
MKIALIIFRLGENVVDDYAKKNNYQLAIENLINYFKTTNTKGVVITNNFWNSTYKDNVQKTVALSNNYNFADIGSLDTDPYNHAYGDFKDGGVGMHPSDFAMCNIADILFYSIVNLDWYKRLK